MPLAYADSATLMRDTAFVSRVKVAILHYAAYILGEPAGTPAHNTRMKWASNVIANPDNIAAALAPQVVMDPNVQSQGAAIDDPTLQSAVETAVNNLM